MAMELDTTNDSDCNQMCEAMNIYSVDSDKDHEMDISTENTLSKQSTLFCKLRNTRNKSNGNIDKKKRIKHQSTAECRIEKDLKEINESKWRSFGAITTININEGNLLHFEFRINPIEGYYRNGIFSFIVSINSDYPFSSPKILSKNNIFHPNIDAETKQIGLNLFQNWSPVLSLNDVIFAIELLFFEPNCNPSSNPSSNNINYMFYENKWRENRYNDNILKQSLILNEFAANLYIKNKQKFDDTVQRIINGCNYNEREWQCCSRDSYYLRNNNNNNNRNHEKANQIITKKSKLLGHRKRRFTEMSLESHWNTKYVNTNKLIDDDAMFNPFRPKKRLRNE